MFVTFQLEEGSIYVVYELEPVPDAIVEEGETNDLATVSDFLQFKVSTATTCPSRAKKPVSIVKIDLFVPGQ